MKLSPLAHAQPPQVLRFGRDAKNEAGPHIAVVDNFSKAVADIDGDGHPDLSHGDLVCRFIRMRVPNARFTLFPLQGTFDMDPAEVKEQLQAVLKQVRDGQAFDAVNMSLGRSTRTSQFSVGPDAQGQPHVVFEQHKKKASPEELAAADAQRKKEGRTTLTSGSLLQHAEQLRHWMRHASDIQERDSLRVTHLMDRLVQKGIPVYVGGGNDGPDFFSFYNLARMAITVGALDARGQKAPYSADNSLIKRFEQGTYNISKVQGGFDLNGDGKADVKDNEVTSQGNKLQPFIDKFAFKPLNDVLATDEEMDAIADAIQKHRINPAQIGLMHQRVFALDKLLEKGWLTPEYYHEFKATGDYVMFNEGRLKLALRTNDKGQLIYSPDGSNRHALHHTYGTSLATPTALALDFARTPLNLTA